MSLNHLTTSLHSQISMEPSVARQFYSRKIVLAYKFVLKHLLNLFLRGTFLESMNSCSSWFKKKKKKKLNGQKSINRMHLGEHFFL